MDPNPSEVFVVVPAYNEAPAIGRCLEGLVEAGFSVVVVDDGSADNTHQEALKYPVDVLRHPCNLGQGAALQTGISFALTRIGCRFIITFDADGQHRPEDIPALVSALEATESSIALGSRFKEGARAVNIPKGKLVVLKLAALFTRLTTGLRVTDTHNGLRAFTREAAGRIHITQNRMSHASEILHQIGRLRLTYVEVPVTVNYTAYSLRKGQSIWNSINILWDSLIGGLK